MRSGGSDAPSTLKLAFPAAVAQVFVRRMSSDLNRLLQQLGDNDINVRLSAADALKKIGEPAVEPLCEMFAHGDKEARWMASSALGRIGDLRAVQPLCQALGDSDSDIRACAVCALGEIGPPAVEALCLMLSHRDWIARACAANALARIGDARAVEPLREALRRIDNPIRRLASWAFAERFDFKDGVRRTARDSEADALRGALEKIGQLCA
jgi:HEAT repeat protein